MGKAFKPSVQSPTFGSGWSKCRWKREVSKRYTLSVDLMQSCNLKWSSVVLSTLQQFYEITRNIFKKLLRIQLALLVQVKSMELAITLHRLRISKEWLRMASFWNGLKFTTTTM